MDLFAKSTLNGKKLDELCVDIINTLGFSLKHPCATKDIKILNGQQIDNYEELVSINKRDLQIYLKSFVFEENDKQCSQKYPWKLQKPLENKQDLKNLLNKLYQIKQHVKMIKVVEEYEFIDIYSKYEKYLPIS
jgi:hypothetical protein